MRVNISNLLTENILNLQLRMTAIKSLNVLEVKDNYYLSNELVGSLH